MSVTRTGSYRYVGAASQSYYTATASNASGTYVEMIASTTTEILIYAVGVVANNQTNPPTGAVEIAIGGAGSEVDLASVYLSGWTEASSNAFASANPIHLPFPIRVPAGSRVSIHGTANSAGSLVLYYLDASKVI